GVWCGAGDWVFWWSVVGGGRRSASLVAIDPLAPLVTFLRLDRERGDGARLEPLERNRLAGLLAIAVGAVLEAGERRVDLGDQLALAVARPPPDRPVGLRGRAARKVRVIFLLCPEMGPRLFFLFLDLLPPREQLLAEVLPLALIHEGLFVGRSVGLGLVEYSGAILLRRHCNPVRKANPCSRGELISSRAMADNNGIETDPDFRRRKRKRLGRR